MQTRPSRPTREDWLLALLTAHEAALGRYAARLVGDPEKARDLVQETFLRLWKAEAGDVGDNPPAWLYTVLRNLCFDHLRKERRMVSLAPEELPDPSTTDVEGGERETGMTSVLAALDRLPASQQEVIRLKFQSGLSYKDISRITGHSVSNVGVLIHTGVKTLRKAMAASPTNVRPGTKGGAS